MIDVTPTISIDENELSFTFIRASGPGGQNVNKVATAAQLRFDIVEDSDFLFPPHILHPVQALCAPAMNQFHYLPNTGSILRGCGVTVNPSGHFKHASE